MKCNFKTDTVTISSPLGSPIIKRVDPPVCLKKSNQGICDGEDNCTEFAPRGVYVILEKD